MTELHSSTDPQRVHSVRMVDGESRTVTMDMVTALAGRTIQSATWMLTSGTAEISSVTNSASDTSARITSQSGISEIVATLALTTGETLAQRIVVGCV